MINVRLLAPFLALALWASAAPAGAADPNWVAAWGAPPDQAGPALPPGTVRQVVRVSLGGTAVRLRLSNLYGQAPVTFGAVRVGRQAERSAVKPGTDRVVTFSGRGSVTIAPGGSALSDAVALPVTALESLTVSLYLPAVVAAPTLHGVSAQTAWLGAGDLTAAPALPGAWNDNSRYFLTDVEVAAAPNARLVVAVGDSITDGVGSTQDRNARWPDALAERLQADPARAHIAVVNSGIAGNRLLNDATDPFIGPSLLNRLDRDVLDKPGVRWVIVLSGGNDITASGMLPGAKDKVTADQIIAGYKSLIDRAHARGLKVLGATFTPRGGASAGGFFALSPENLAKRDAVVAWIRTSGAFDAVIDFERAVRDPAQPDRLLPAYDGDGQVHLNDAGYRAMAAAIDLKLLAE